MPLHVAAHLAGIAAADASTRGDAIEALGARVAYRNDDSRTVHFTLDCSDAVDTHPWIAPLCGPNSLNASGSRWCNSARCAAAARSVDTAISDVSLVAQIGADISYFRDHDPRQEQGIVDRWRLARNRATQPLTTCDTHLAAVHAAAVTQLTAALDDVRPVIVDHAADEAALALASDIDRDWWLQLRDELRDIDGPDIAIAAANLMTSSAIGVLYGPFPTEPGAGEPVTVPFIIGAALIACGATCALDASAGSTAGTLLTDGWPNDLAGLRELADTVAILERRGPGRHTHSAAR